VGRPGPGSEGTTSWPPIVAVVREAAAHDGRVGDLAWERAVARGWSDEQLAEAFASLGSRATPARGSD
jgi:hypothetical protein